MTAEPKRTCVQLLLTQGDLDALNEAADTAKISRSAVMRNLIAGIRIQPPPDVDLTDLIRGLRQNESVLSRIQRDLELCGTADEAGIRRCIAKLDALEEDIRRRLVIIRR